MPLKRHYIDFQAQTGNKVIPQEVDRYEQYTILHPMVGTASVGTAAGTAGALAVTLVASNLDYPRNLQVIATGQVATVTVYGQDQFGGSVIETISGGTAVGTSVFARIGTATLTKADGAGTVEIGVAIGTTSASPIFGLPFKVGAASDVKMVTWSDADTSKALNVNGAAPGATVNTSNHSIRIEVSGGIAAADSFVVLAKPTYNAPGDSLALMANL